MRSKSHDNIVAEILRTLVRHYGVASVRVALDRLSNGQTLTANENVTRQKRGKRKPAILEMLAPLRSTSPERFDLLTDFYGDLMAGKILPEVQDIRQFAQLIGLKELDGQSRRELIPKLLMFLMNQHRDQLKADIEIAGSISDQQRKLGYSILTDKLLGDR
jgi:hypothetical protein